jgi:hypothetical protein
LGTQVNDGVLPLVPTLYKDNVTTTDTREITITGNWVVASGVNSEYTSGLGTVNGTLNAVIGENYSLLGETLTEDEQAEINGMFTVTVTTIDVPITIGGSANIVVTVVFNIEPSSLALYEKVAEGQLIITITLSVDAA